MWAILRPSWPVLARPTYSSISLGGWPAAATRLGSLISSGIVASIPQYGSRPAMTQNRRREPDLVLAAFDAEVRRSVRPDGSGARIEADRFVVRWGGAADQGWSGIAWSGLGAADADAVIADQMAYFAARGEKFEWKLYDYDQPPDLSRRLLAAGFAAEGEESLMV